MPVFQAQAARILERTVAVSLQRCSFELLEQIFQAPRHCLAFQTRFSQLSENSSLRYLTDQMPAWKLLQDGASRWPWPSLELFLSAMVLTPLVLPLSELLALTPLLAWGLAL